MKSILKNVFNKLGYSIMRLDTSNIHDSAIVSLEPGGERRGEVLLAYIIEPFLLDNESLIPTSHTHYWESYLMAKVFLESGYAVDVISFKNKTFVPRKNYCLFVSARSNFQGIARQLRRDCLKVVHLDTAHWVFNNRAAYARCLGVQSRKGVCLKHFRLIEPNWAIEHADLATVLGNEFTMGTYRYAGKSMYPLPVPTVAVYPWREEKDHGSCKNSFLWFASSGLVNRGLDLVLEVFAQMPDCQLYICGPIQQEKDFQAAYFRELYQTPNIHTVGWVDVAGGGFSEIVDRCAAVVYPSCSEGQSGAVLTCMQAGLIPVVSYESGVSVDDFGFLLGDCSLEEIRRTVCRITELSALELKERSRRAWEYARTHHSRERFVEEYRKFVRTVTDKGRLRELLESISGPSEAQLPLSPQHWSPPLPSTADRSV